MVPRTSDPRNRVDAISAEFDSARIAAFHGLGFNTVQGVHMATDYIFYFFTFCSELIGCSFLPQ
jgi:hypothetical protein